MHNVPVFNVLVVEDNPADADLLLECFNGVDARCTVVRDGNAALEHLRIENAAATDLVVLDVNPTDVSGLEFLHEIRGDTRLRHTPVIVFSQSDAREDVVAAYNMGANCYLRKPYRLAEFRTLVAWLEDWLRLAALPTRAA